MKYWTIRHPVGNGRAGWREDPQDVPPVGWCVRCGGEVWELGEDVCEWCVGTSRTSNARPYKKNGRE